MKTPKPKPQTVTTDLQAKASVELGEALLAELPTPDPVAATAATLIREHTKPDPLHVIEELFKDPGVSAELARAGVEMPANSSAQEKLTSLTRQKHILPKMLLLKLIASHVFHSKG